MTVKEPEHITMIRDSVRRVLNDCAPLEKVAQWDRDDFISRDMLKPVSALGLCAVAVPKE